MPDNTEKSITTENADILEFITSEEFKGIKEEYPVFLDIEE